MLQTENLKRVTDAHYAFLNIHILLVHLFDDKMTWKMTVVVLATKLTNVMGDAVVVYVVL